MKKRGTVATEHAEQATVIAWWKLACKKYALPEFVLYSVPNGAFLAGGPQQRAIQMNNLKRAGLRVGIPDLNLDVPSLNVIGITYHGLRIEMKRKLSGAVSLEQLTVIRHFQSSGYRVAIAFGFDQARAIIEEYLVGKI